MLAARSPLFPNGGTLSVRSRQVHVLCTHPQDPIDFISVNGYNQNDGLKSIFKSEHKKEIPMPKPITEYEREQTKKAIVRHTHQLILDRKGIKNITVDDIIHSASMGKSTFYSVYKSKEACLCDVLENHLLGVLEKADSLRQEEMTSEERTRRFFREVYLAKDSLVSFITVSAIESIFRKLPPEYKEKEQMFLGGGVKKYAIDQLRYDETQSETLFALFCCIDYIVVDRFISERAREKTLNYLVEMMVTFFKNNQYETKGD